ncbi:MAG: prolyl oligopeptidase family serine peptidase [Victivallaceae bacterium]|nr:prolyl oligopeptidase family serine peptidase [Victivallaceae bacterium]
MKNEFIELEVVSSLDGSREKNLFFIPENIAAGGKVPLVVWLHTWSADRFNQVVQLELCRKRDWALLLPEFRGPNLVKNPRAQEACGSQLACQDIIDAVEFVKNNYPVDEKAVFLAGGSGGGHMSLVTGAYKPEMWRGVSSWCPITDVALWHRYYGKGNGYAPHMEACCGGAPGDSPEVDYQYSRRSPMSYLTKLAKVNLSVHHGRFDKSVPCIHTINLAVALNALAPEKFFFEIFDGGHEAKSECAFAWFDKILGSSGNTTQLTG